MESIANMDKLPIYGATLYVMPMKIGEGCGAPLRIGATFPKILRTMEKMMEERNKIMEENKIMENFLPQIITYKG
ncbi:hypothetical protein CEXT_230801 [Caerostris extrusa]|uniref:Uncharacterized protein n=1 Tax=Caerostris extrusa TaxID=172846 RepID=A0AAV4RIP6_CAEEX|nr:hypothetical protein CEXT_230801 [Caerostris extrusa]